MVEEQSNMSDTSSEEDSKEGEEEKTDESDVDNNEDINHPGLSGMHKDTHIIPKENLIIYTVHFSMQTSQKCK